ncbi:flagellar hook-length control protein FliK [Aeromonas sp. NJAU223]|uniref:flagellar hook-length control protein FliK n=1 Tax=Aeromonas sp. NJAU223 TaxID=3115650 RepID=UPI003DAA1D89
MIQTQLITASAQAKSVDGAATPALPALGGEGDLPLPGEGKALFADAMARQLGQQDPARQGDGALKSPLDAKSLAASETSQNAPHQVEKADEAELPPDDFLQQLQASLRQDTTLVAQVATPPQAPLPAAHPDGNDLPPESPSIAGVPGKDAVAGAGQQGTLPQNDLAQRTELAAALAPSGKGTGDAANSAAEKSAAHGAASPDALGRVAGADAALPGKQAASPVEDGVDSRETGADLNASERPVADKGIAAKEGGSKPESQPLSGPERAAQLAKVVTGETDGANRENLSAAQTANDKQAGVARVFGEGVASATMVSADQPAASAEGKADGRSPRGADASAQGAGGVTVNTDDASGQARAGGRAQESGTAQASVAKAEGAVSSQTPVVTPAGTAQVSDPQTPALAAPQQVLARHESQGPQASLAALSAGIQQMESAPTVVVKANSELRKTELKGSLDEVGKSAGLEAKPAQQAEAGATTQQLAAQGNGEQKSVAETGARRDAQNLPHLKLATPETPTQLHQKVNLMLTDKLQQAEIQLDPLGLGKMKIQIQMGADSQASVNFVVQHGQTREMLEQAMPRLRDMLAGQGIQLGQTQVQQQPQSQQQAQQHSQLAQQQSQGQASSGGEGRQGNGGAGGRGQGESEGTAHTLSLLVESANDAGIDFYA